MTRYLDNGEVEIDNNGVENALRPLALGRKNYLFAGSHDGAQRAAVYYALFLTCLLHEVNPQAWLTDVLKKIPEYSAKRVHELLPHRWKLAQQKPLRKSGLKSSRQPCAGRPLRHTDRYNSSIARS